jgi:protein SCO1/2
MNRKTLWAGILSLLAVGVAALIFVLARPVSFRGTMYDEPYPQAADFALTRANGETFRLSEQKGKIVLLFFGYTACPDVCPTTLAELRVLMEELGDKTGQVQVVFVSVDPERDTPEKIQEYVEHFNADFIGLTGASEDLQIIWDDYGVFRERVESESAFGYIINHTARTYLIDQNGSLRLSFGFQTPVEDMVHDIEILLNQ